jgi:hypothetical protein
LIRNSIKSPYFSLVRGFGKNRPPCSIRLVLCLAVCAAISDSVSASNLPTGPVQVDPSIPYPEKMTFVGLSQSVLLGASMGTSGMVKEYVRNAAGQRRNLTPVPVFVREEFSEAIRASGFTPEDGPGDSRFRLAVRKYGFAEASMLSRQVRPLMTLYAELVSSEGKILWSHEAVAKSDDQALPAILPEELRNNSEEQEQLLRAAAHRASEKLMENYNKKR